MKLDIVIPTYMREEKLRRALSSIRNAMDYLPGDVMAIVRVFYSNISEQQLAELEMGWHWIEHRLLSAKEFRLPEFWNDRMEESQADALCYLNDDVLLEKGSLVKAFEILRQMNFDGVVGFDIKNRTEVDQPCLAAFGIIGMKYADRFPRRQVFCPEYTSLFADMELQCQAEKLGRFKYLRGCSVVHLHPAYSPNDHDFTHLHTRRNLIKDRETFDRRRALGLIWGLQS